MKHSFSELGWKLKLEAKFQLSPKGDQCLISPYSNIAQSNKKVVRKRKQVSLEILLIITTENVWRTVWRIYMLILGFKGLNPRLTVTLKLPSEINREAAGNTLPRTIKQSNSNNMLFYPWRSITRSSSTPELHLLPTKKIYRTTYEYLFDPSYNRDTCNTFWTMEREARKVWALNGKRFLNLLSESVDKLVNSLGTDFTAFGRANIGERVNSRRTECGQNAARMR